MATLLVVTAPPTGAKTAQTAPGENGSSEGNHAGALSSGEQVRGWNVLTDSVPDGLKTIEAAPEYDINHLQISHDVIHDLRHVRDNRRLEIAETYVDAARAAGIQEVTFWDHSLYSLSYYPDEFKTGPGGTIDLDNPDFWDWFREDYREMLEIAPPIDGLILTFVETGARVEQQHSDVLETDEEKLAYLVDQVADVVIDEYGMNLYVRNFGYYPEEILRIVGAIDLIENDKVRVMNKETPHDFFLTHPVDYFTQELDREVLIEFDTTGEFHGQSIIANTFPQVFMDRWRHFENQDNVVGYVARTDRYRTSGAIETPNEINLYGLKRAVEDPDVTTDDVYREFTEQRYGRQAAKQVADVFRMSEEIILSTMYTLGLNIANHSTLNYDPYCSSYHRHVSGKWLEPPKVRVEHTVNQTFNYWTDLVDHLAPVSCKRDSTVDRELPWVVENGWIDRDTDKMNEQYLRYILREKNWGVRLAETARERIEGMQDRLSDEAHEELRALYARTELTAKLHRAVSKAYFGYRVYVNDVQPRDEDWLRETIWDGLDEAEAVAEEIRAYDGPLPRGQWNWRGDADEADEYYDRIANGWDRYDDIAVPRPGVPITEVTVTSGTDVQIRPGESFEVAGEFAVSGSDPAVDVSFAPAVPDGWSVDGDPVEAGTVEPDETLEDTWTVSVPEDAEAGPADVSLVASFRGPEDGSDDPKHEDEASLQVEVLQPGWLIVREAESDLNTLSGNARISSGCDNCSGGFKVGSIGRGEDNYIEFNDLTVDAAGDYTLFVDYMVNGTRDFFVTVNGEDSIEVTVSGTSWSDALSTELTVTLEAGDNVIRVHNDDGPAPDFDRIVIAESA